MKWLPGALYGAALRGASMAGHKKAQSMLTQRRDQAIPEGPFDLWVHAASLGEYLMAQPLIQRAHQANLRVLVTFFSPSGADIARRNESYFAFVPLDRLQDVAHFLARTQPRQALFMKYDLWPGTTAMLRKHHIPYAVAFAQVKPGAAKLWPWNPWERPSWSGASHVFHQTEESLALWTQAGYRNGFLAGDGRFDKVGQRPAPEGLEVFTDHRPVLVVGSSWQKEEALLLPLLMRFPELKVILAPHDVSRVDSLDSQLPVPRVRWSKFESYASESQAEARVLLVDSLGDLPALYACGHLALVGGAFGPGLHNILEPLVHGLPVVCGPKVQGHWEASDSEAPVTILPMDATPETLATWIKIRLENPPLRFKEAEQAKIFIAKHRGASQRVWEVLSL